MDRLVDVEIAFAHPTLRTLPAAEDTLTLVDW